MKNVNNPSWQEMVEMVSSRIYQPLFMFGFERSGTTLLSMIMGAHPDLAVPLSVTGLWYRYHEKRDQYGPLCSPQNLEEMVDDLLQEERIRLWDVSMQKQAVLDRLDGTNYPAVIEAFNRVYADQMEKPLWANLDIVTLDEMHRINQWFPEARFIHIVRDGRDVALSHETMPYGASNTVDCAQSWERRVTMNLRMGDILGPERYLMIRFEDLVMDTEATLKTVCAFAGLSYSDKMLNYGDMVSSKIPDDKRWLWPDLEKKPQQDNCFAWRQKMDNKRRIVFENEAGQLLQELGYERYQSVPKSTMARLYEAWCFLDRGGRLKRLKQKCGLGSKSTLEKRWAKASA